MCLRSVHSLHSFVPLHFVALHFTSLLHSVHFTHLSTAHKRSSFSLSKNPITQFRFGIWLMQASTRLLRQRIYKSHPTHLHQLKRLHFTQPNSFLSFSRFTCLCLRTDESGMLYFFLRLVYPILRSNTTMEFLLIKMKSGKEIF